MVSPRVVVVVVCLMSMTSESLSQEVFARWKAWYHQTLKPCLRSCPHQTQFVCGFDHGRQRYAVASSACALTRHNACQDEDYQEVPVQECLSQFKFYNKGRIMGEQQEQTIHVID